VVATILAAARTPTPLVQAQAANSGDPLSLFSKMMPVFMHPRCVNCHGLTDPSQNTNHGGGLVTDDASCQDGGCHNAPEVLPWKLGPQFAGNTARQLCEVMAGSVNSSGPAGFLAHLRDDELIQLSFLGLAGGAKDPPAAPPPMTHAQFLTAAEVWVEDGLAVCDRELAIVHTEEIDTNTTYPQGPDIDLNVKQSGKREVTVRFVNGRFEANIQVKGSITYTQTIRAVVEGVACQSIITSSSEYSDVDDPDPVNPNRGMAATPRFDVRFHSGGVTCTVTVRLPQEKHRQIDNASVRDGCGTGLKPSPPDALEQVWPGTSFVLQGTLPHSRDRTRLAGHTHKTLTTRVSPDEDPWLHDHYAAAAPVDDGSRLHPVTVHTRWNFV